MIRCLSSFAFGSNTLTKGGRFFLARIEERHKAMASPLSLLRANLSSQDENSQGPELTIQVGNMAHQPIYSIETHHDFVPVPSEYHKRRQNVTQPDVHDVETRLSVGFSFS